MILHSNALMCILINNWKVRPSIYFVVQAHVQYSYVRSGWCNFARLIGNLGKTEVKKTIYHIVVRKGILDREFCGYVILSVKVSLYSML